MPGRIIAPARWVGDAPFILTPQYAIAETFKAGALLVIQANGEYVECGADPILVSAVALQDAGSNPGYLAANAPATFTGRQQTVSVVPADAITVFSMRGVNGATDPVTPLLTNIGESYGALKDANGIWTLDLAEVATLVFTVVDFDADQKIFFCVFNPAALV